MSGAKGGLGVAIMRDDEVVSPLAFTAEGGEISTETIVICKEGQKVYVQVMIWNRVIFIVPIFPIYVLRLVITLIRYVLYIFCHDHV